MEHPSDYHDNHGDCPHNENSETKCTCKRIRNRRPFKVVKVHDKDVSRRTNPDLVYEIYPKTGTIALREQGRRTRFTIQTADLYDYLIRRAALIAIAQRKAKRKQNKKLKLAA